jgi:hypothetical protein
MKKTLRFVGTFAEVGGKRLDRFGQVVEFDESITRDAVLGGVALIPADRFDEIGFTPEEISAFAMPVTHDAAPPEFLEKKLLAILAYEVEREAMKEKA